MKKFIELEKYRNAEIITKNILKKVLEYTGESKNSLAKKIGLPRSQNLYDIENGKVKSISSELSEKIVITYPELNRDWLLNGEGEMLKSGKQHDEEYTVPAAKHIAALKEIIELQRELLNKRDEEEFAKPLKRAK